MKFPNILSTLTGTIFLLMLVACSEEPDYKNNFYGNFDALAQIIDTRYCFFEEKGIDWDSITREYREKINEETSLVEFFMICADMLNTLEDGHVNLSSEFTSSYYRKWWSDYPQDFNMRTLQQYYFGFHNFQTSGISYIVFNEKIGYMYYPSFSSGIGELNLDYVLALLRDTDVLIIDVRDNGGGLLSNVEILVSRFIYNDITGGFIRHKEGPGHDDFSEPYEIVYHPAPDYRVHWDTAKPVYVLTNRSCFSAANDFVAVMKSLPNVKIIGARTGGGGGLPFTSELPNGWAVRFSACPMYAPDGSITEFGIDPTEGYEKHCTADELAAGHDAILDYALSLATQYSDSLRRDSL